MSILSFFTNRRKTNRNIYRYWDGVKTREVDPAVAWRVMWEHPECNPQNDFGPATGSGPDGQYDPMAMDRVLKMARDMFGVKQWSETTPGLTVDETMALLWDFLRFMENLKKKRDSIRTTSPHTDSTSSPPANSTTPSESDSVSTDLEPKSDAPLSSSKRSVRL